MESPSLLLFDLDGTLVDTAPEMHSALNILLKETGVHDLITTISTVMYY